MKKNTILKFLTAISCLSYSGIATAQIIVSNTTELRNAMSTAVAGDEIIVMPGVYEPGGKVKDAVGKWVRFTSDQSGEAGNPIILRGSDSANRPLLQCPDNDIYDGAVLSITGDYWEIKNLKIAQGSKGVMLDTANHCTLYNIDVQDVGEEAIHLRSGASDNLIDNCTISNTGVQKPDFGEGIYIGSDRAQHDTYNPDCNRNIVQNCILGPNIRAEHFDIKEGTEYTIVRDCTMDGTGITGENFSDSFLDVKGIYTSVYRNTMTVNGNTNINSFIDFNNRTSSSYNYKTGYKNEFFENTFDTGSLTSIATATSRGAKSTEIHVYNNTRIPDSPWIKTSNTAAATDNYEFRPEWSPEPDPALNVNDEKFERSRFKIYPNPVATSLRVLSTKFEALQYTIFDFSGKIIRNNASLANGNIDVSYLTKGTYVLQIISSNQQTTQSIFVKK